MKIDNVDRNVYEKNLSIFLKFIAKKSEQRKFLTEAKIKNSFFFVSFDILIRLENELPFPI